MSICRNDLVDPEDAKATHHPAETITSYLEQITALVAPKFEGRLEACVMSISVDEDVSLHCQSSSLFRVLYNLAVNAAHALIAHGGSRIHLKVLRENDSIQFIVADDGPGLPQHIIDHLYPRLDRVVQSRERLGYGLTSAIGLANKMSGALHLVQSSSLGCTFCLVLPDRLDR